MTEVIARLSTEHTELQQALAGLRPRLFRSDEGRVRLSRVRDLLRTHFQEEHEQLDPVLEKAAQSDVHLAGHIRRMSDDLRIVTDLAEDFFHKYEQGELKLIEFATDHGALLTILRIRLRREEDTLFPLYETLSRN